MKKSIIFTLLFSLLCVNNSSAYQNSTAQSIMETLSEMKDSLEGKVTFTQISAAVEEVLQNCEPQTSDCFHFGNFLSPFKSYKSYLIAIINNYMISTEKTIDYHFNKEPNNKYLNRIEDDIKRVLNCLNEKYQLGLQRFKVCLTTEEINQDPFFNPA